MWDSIKTWLSGAGKRTAESDSQSERRIWVRRPCDLEAFFQTPGDEFASRQPARVRNISRGGMNIVVPQEFAPGDQLSVELPGNHERPAFTVLACVVHAAKQSDGEWALGCSFADELTDEDLEPFGARRERPAAGLRRRRLRENCAKRSRSWSASRRPTVCQHVRSIAACRRCSIGRGHCSLPRSGMRRGGKVLQTLATGTNAFAAHKCGYEITYSRANAHTGDSCSSQACSSSSPSSSGSEPCSAGAGRGP